MARAMTAGVQAAKHLLIADFEGPDYGPWKAATLSR